MSSLFTHPCGLHFKILSSWKLSIFKLALFYLLTISLKSPHILSYHQINHWLSYAVTVHPRWQFLPFAIFEILTKLFSLWVLREKCSSLIYLTLILLPLHLIPFYFYVINIFLRCCKVIVSMGCSYQISSNVFTINLQVSLNLPWFQCCKSSWNIHLYIFYSMILLVYIPVLFIHSTLLMYPLFLQLLHIE